MPAADWGTLIPPPKNYPANLPLFYRTSAGSAILRPLNIMPKYVEGDVLQTLLYLQTIIGYNRTDYWNAFSAAWQYADGSGGARIWVQSAFKADNMGDGGGDFLNISHNNQSTDGALYAKLQAQYIANNSDQPWLAAMQAKGGGIDLMTIPAPTDVLQPRPSWYPDYLPSLYKSSGGFRMWPAGSMNTKPKLKNNKSGGYKQYVITAEDVANLCVYAQPIIYAGPTPYPTNWYANDDVNGAMAMRFKVSLNVDWGFSNSQAQTWGAVGDMMTAPVLDPNPYASGFSTVLETIVKGVISFFAGKIPGGTKLVNAAYMAGNLSGGQYITGSDYPPGGAFTKAVFDAAHNIEQKNEQRANEGNMLLIALAAAIGWYAYDRKLL